MDVDWNMKISERTGDAGDDGGARVSSLRGSKANHEPACVISGPLDCAVLIKYSSSFRGHNFSIFPSCLMLLPAASK